MRPRDSDTDPIRVDWLQLDLPGQVGLTIAPGKHGGALGWRRDLMADLRRLQEVYGVATLVSLIEDRELVGYRIGPLFERARELGMRSLRLPIPDGGLPPDAAALAVLLNTITAALRAGESVVIHCIGGLGRSGTVAGCLLVEQGLEPEQALERLVAARGPNCPENERQREFVRRWGRPTRAPGPLSG